MAYCDEFKTGTFFQGFWTPVYRFTETSIFFFPAPFFVVTITTPFADLAPYIAAEAASFNTSIDAMSFGLRKSIPPPIITPSTTYKGSDPLIEDVPRIRTTEPDPG